MPWRQGEWLYSGRYIVKNVLGEGGAGITYLALDKKGNHIAVKTLNDRILERPDFLQFQKEFLNEAIKLAICSHPHIVKIAEVFPETAPRPQTGSGNLMGRFLSAESPQSTKDIWCIAMEYVRGETLHDRAIRKGGLPEAEALRYIRQIGSALTEVHARGLLHRDVKPANIVVSSAMDAAKLIDFGIARALNPIRTQTARIEVSHGFAPPEQYELSAELGTHTDVYALAATLYYLLTANVPPQAISRLGAGLIPPQQLNPAIADITNQAILKGMELKIEDRPASVRDWLGLLPDLPPDLLPDLRSQLAGKISSSANSAELEAQLEAARRQREELEQGLARAEAENQRLKAALSTAQEGQQQLAQYLANEKQQLQKSESRLAELEAEKRQLEIELLSGVESKRQVELALETEKNRRQAVQRSLASLEAEKYRLEAARRTEERRDRETIDRLKAELGQAREAASSLATARRQLEERESRLAELEAEKRELKAELERAKDARTLAEQALASAIANNSASQRQTEKALQEAKEQLRKTESRLARLEEEKRQLKGNLETSPSQPPETQSRLPELETEKPLSPLSQIELPLPQAEYARLRDLLAAHKWREADRETADRMLAAMGKESWSDVYYSDIQSFPCEDLRAIDQLWLIASNGRFGFSVQKEIWLELGGKVNPETECCLGDRLGWRKGGKWLKSSEIAFSSSAPRGHLPFLCCDRASTSLKLTYGRVGGSLLSRRAASCNLFGPDATILRDRP